MEAPRLNPGDEVTIHNWRTGEDKTVHTISTEEDWVDYEVVNGGTLENPWSGAAWWDPITRRWIDGEM